MAYKLGLKLWSVNTDAYYEEAKKLYSQGVFDYVELYVVPNSLETIPKWKKLKIPYILHNAHFAQGFNLANKDKAERNRQIYEQTKQFADELSVPYIIFHGGIDGDIKETAHQLASFNEPRALIENKPMIAIPNKMNGKFCRGYSPEEIELIIKTANCGFCLDFGHVVCSAASQNIEHYSYIKEFLKFKPKMFHLTDNIDMTTGYDTHEHLGDGELNFLKIKSFLPNDAIITLETDKKSKENIDDFILDCKFMRNLENGF